MENQASTIGNQFVASLEERNENLAKKIHPGYLSLLDTYAKKRWFSLCASPNHKELLEMARQHAILEINKSIPGFDESNLIWQALPKVRKVTGVDVNVLCLHTDSDKLLTKLPPDDESEASHVVRVLRVPMDDFSGQYLGGQSIRDMGVVVINDRSNSDPHKDWLTYGQMEAVDPKYFEKQEQGLEGKIINEMVGLTGMLMPYGPRSNYDLADDYFVPLIKAMDSPHFSPFALDYLGLYANFEITPNNALDFSRRNIRVFKGLLNRFSEDVPSLTQQLMACLDFSNIPSTGRLIRFNFSPQPGIAVGRLR